ncbi:T9SS type B sorting domain-containing protein [Lutibacter holmesii]|uniref:T9SS type B sorting domain-containing protein n=1 Tax=Lutibacter holmesii TaxID=1137985 RepID=A0ABW3WMK2_9FLAO
MNTFRLQNFLFLVFVLIIIQSSFGQLSKVHYIPPLTAAENGNANPEDQYFYISTPSISDVAYTIKPVGLSSNFYIEGVVSNTSPKVIELGTGYGALFIPSISTSQIVNQRGYIIEATDQIYVSVRMNAGGGAQAGALVSKGQSALGTEFRIGAFTNQNPTENYLSFLSVMATEDNTTVTFSDISNNTEILNSSKTFPYSETFDRGESYTIAMNSYSTVHPTNNKDGLIGALVTSDKPVVVNCGSTNGSFHNGNGRDYGIDQIVGADKIGDEYIFVRGFGSDDWEDILIVAHEDNTSIYIRGNTTTPYATINAGEYSIVEGNEYSATGNIYVQTSKPVFAYQGVGGLGNNGSPNEANQGMFFVPPISCETKGNVDNIANIDNIGDKAYSGGVSIVTKKGATITINDLPLSSYSTTGPFDVLGSPNHITYKVLGLSGSITVKSDDELYCAYFNYNGSATSGSFYSGFPTPPEISFDAEFTTLGNCIDNIILEVANINSFDSIEWYYDDGSGNGFIATGNTSKTLTPTFPGESPFSTGTYKIIGVTCTGESIESIEVPVSICPDDTDNDGIIDNFDIDNDNDGILNCTESYGDAPIPLENPLSGTLSKGSYSFNGAITPVGSTSNSIFGDADGNFQSEVISKNGLAASNVTYSLDFNNNLNLLFKLPSGGSLGTTTLNSDQEFIIKVSNDKTITLLDPDDQLLIDTNYDGDYESGVTQFSSFEIRFKIKGTALSPGDSTFEFAASMVNHFSFTHINLSETSTNTAVFKIKATCVPLDSDLDGVTNEFDNDSENDGIPDIVEGSGILNVLSANDSNNDGLDDIFGIGITPIDTDNDTVFDYLDLDSDNDGIYDLFETGQLGLLSDTDFNGVIDWLDPSDTNGWDDNAETSPNSGVMSYILNDEDNDGLYSYIDLDSDGDACSDVIEAGFSDGNNNNMLGDSTPIVNSFGVITNANDGYSTPNSDYLIAGIITINTQPVDTIICELDTTKLTIETNTVDSYQWEVSTNGINWNTVVNDLIYSNATTNELTITNTPLSYNNNIYRVYLKKSGNSCDLISNEIVLSVNALPIANTVSNLENCDDLTDGDDTNEIVQNFDLESQTSTILGAQLPSNYLVTYHLSQADADTGTSALTSPFENSSNPQTIFVRVENIQAGCSISNSNFQLIVNSPPIANPVTNLIECDNLDDGIDTNGIVQNFDLESQTTTILGSQLASEFTVTYHLSQNEAIAGMNALTSPHENRLNPYIQPIFVRVENNITGCINTQQSFNLIVNPLPTAETLQNMELCDTNDDGDDTNGKVQTFDLESQTSIILGTQSPTEYAVTYHLTEADAVSGNNPQNSPFTNTSTPQTIYTRVLNKNTNCINTHITFDVIVHPLPTTSSSEELKQCDNDTDGFSLFNLTEVNEKISTNAANETFTYYETQADAISQSNAITNPTAFENRTVNSDIVWASVESKFGCRREAEIKLFVSTTGIPATYQREFYQCDDFLDENGNDNANNDNRDGITTFDFSEVDAEIRAIFPAGQQIFITYYKNEADALAEENAIADISNYRNIGYPNSQEIYVRVDSEINNDCLGFGAHITLTVEELPVANPVTIDRQCDDDDDGMFPFDTSLIETTVINGQSNVTVSYFDQNGNVLPSPLPNPFLSTSQIITIQVANSNTLAPDGPCFDETTLEFIVDKSPVAYPVTMAPVCDDESNDGVYDFDTSTIQSTILGAQTGMEVHYYNANGNELSSPLPNPFTTQTQTITVEVINPLNSICTASTTIDFIVNPLPDFEVVTPQIICITEPESTITLAVFPDDTSEVFTYEWKDSSNNIISTQSTANVSNPGNYTASLTKTDGTLCTRTKSIDVNASSIATITQNDIIIEDDSDNNTITILTDNLGIGDYEFALDDDYGYQDEPYFDYVEAGIHTVFVRDKNNCGTTQIEVSIIGFPKFFTPNNDGYNDTWNVLGLDPNYYPSSIIYIFDRFGKLIQTIKPNGNGWDGYYNGEIVPSTDYWFSIELTNIHGETQVRKGHFSLIRRQ